MCRRASSSGDNSLPVKTTTGRSLSEGSSRKLLQNLEAAHVGQPQVEHRAIVHLLLHYFERFGAGGNDGDIDVVVAQQLFDAELFGGIVLDDQQPLAPRSGVFLDLQQRSIQALGCGRLGDERERAARKTMMTVLVHGEHLHRDVPRAGILLQVIQHGPARACRAGRHPARQPSDDTRAPGRELRPLASRPGL